MILQQIGNLEEYIKVNNQLLESYRNLVKIQQDKIGKLEALLDLTEKAKEGYKELYLRVNEKFNKELCLRANETIKELQSEIDSSRKDDSHIKA